MLYVSIDGSKHQSIALRQRCPFLPGRVVVQDLPHIMEEVRQNPLPDFERIEIHAYDMFTPQAIIRAQANYFQSILHDRPDDK